MSCRAKKEKGNQMNKAILVGRITADLELKKTQSGVSVCSFTVAVNRRFARAGEERKADFTIVLHGGRRRSLSAIILQRAG